MKKIYLIVATKPEWAPFKNKLSFMKVLPQTPIPYYEAKIGSMVQIHLCQLGIGPVRCQLALDWLSSSHDFKDTDAVIHFGLSGALDTSMKVGDIVLPEHVCAHQQELIPMDSKLRDSMMSCLEPARYAIHYGGLYSSSSVLATHKEKKDVQKSSNCLSVDMETYWMSRFFSEKKIPFVSLRAIFDEMDMDLKNLSQSRMINAKGELSPLGVARDLLENPKLIAQLPAFQRASQLGNQRLFEIISRWINQKFG